MSFGESQAMAGTPADRAPEIGITTAVKDLGSALMENASITDNIKSALGISNPENGAKGSDPSASLASVIRQMTSRIHSTNGNLLDILRHINS